MTPSIRVTAVMTHPVQYCSPLFRFIASDVPEIALSVVYASSPTPEQQGEGFGESFTWDAPLREGYDSVVVRPARPAQSFVSDDFWGLNVPEIQPAIMATRPDVVLLHGWHSITQLRAGFVCRRRGIPLIYRGDNQPNGNRGALKRFRSRVLLGAFQRYLSVGTRSHSYLRSMGVPEELVFESPHAVDNRFFAESASPFQNEPERSEARRHWGLSPIDFVVLFVGKLEAKKRVEDLIAAASLMDPSPRLLIAGAGPLESLRRDEATRLGLDARWLGFVNQSGLGKAYGVSDCLVLPSDARETWGLVVNEAMATGLPCVVSDSVGCAPDLVESGKTGYVYPTGDTRSLADALNRVRDERVAGTPFDTCCRTKIAEYSLDAAARGLLLAGRSALGLH